MMKLFSELRFPAFMSLLDIIMPYIQQCFLSSLNVERALIPSDMKHDTLTHAPYNGILTSHEGNKEVEINIKVKVSM